MEVRRLHVTDFAAIREADVEFGPGLNVLLGPNDLGTSTLAEAGFTRAKHASLLRCRPCGSIRWSLPNSQRPTSEVIRPTPRGEARKRPGEACSRMPLTG